MTTMSSSSTNETFVDDSGVRSMDFRDWLSVERFLLQIVREEKKLSDVNVADAEPDLPWNFSVQKTLKEAKDAKQRSHRTQTER